MNISVVLPTCHRNDLLANCLDRLAPGEQDCGIVSGAECKSDSIPRGLFSYEVIVTDDGSSSTAKEMISSHYRWAKWVPGPGKGPAANRNSGARHAQGEWLAFIDDDCVPDRRWLQGIWTAAFSEDLDVVEGKTVIPDKVDNPFRQGVENLAGGQYWSCNLAVRRDVFSRMEGFDEDFLEAGGEDMEFAFRIRKKHLNVYFVPAALVLHPTRRVGWRQLIRRTFLIRWILLYRIKTGETPPVGASNAKILWRLFSSQLTFLVRNTIHLVTRPDSTQWKTRLFWQAWNWATFPVVFPYLVRWEFTFRKIAFGARK